MNCRHNEELEYFVAEAKKVTEKGKVASYIPALAEISEDDLSAAVYFTDGTCVSAGDVEKKIHAPKYIKSAVPRSCADGPRPGKSVSLRGAGADR